MRIVLIIAVALLLLAAPRARAQVTVTPPAPASDAVSRVWAFPGVRAGRSLVGDERPCARVLNLGAAAVNVQVGLISPEGEILSRQRFTVAAGAQGSVCLPREDSFHDQHWIAVVADRPVLATVHQWARTDQPRWIVPGTPVNCDTPRGVERLCGWAGRELSPAGADTAPVTPRR